MGIGDYLSAKSENVIMLGATGFAQSKPLAFLEIGALLDMELAGFTGDGDRAQEILESLGILINLAQMSEREATETKYKYMNAAASYKKVGDKSRMYAYSMLSALYRRSIPAAKGKPKDVEGFAEMATAIATTIAVYRLSQSVNEE